MKALAKRVEDRYQSAAAMRSDIERYLSGHPVHAAPPPAPETEVVPAVAPVTATTTMAATRPPADDEDDTTGRNALLILLGVLVVGLIALAAFFLPRLFESAPEDVQVPNLIGLTEREASLEIVDAGLQVGRIDREASATVEADHVIRQSPNRDTYAAPGSTVDLVVSLGKPEVEVPYVVGPSRQDARDALESLDLKVKMVEEDSDEPRDEVLRTDPSQGTRVRAGSTVTVFWSDGPEEVPDVVGMTQAEAEKAIRDAGFTPDAVPYGGETTEPKGTVVRQSPAGGTADQGDTITIFISTYEEPTPTPTPTPTDTTSPSPTDSPTLPTESPQPRPSRSG
ncbi:MAG: PASTA domain-containing protein [Nocardioides sp.]|nr:PASTA domain-containing protein [Nocardioides sp.]